MGVVTTDSDVCANGIRPSLAAKGKTGLTSWAHTSDAHAAGETLHGGGTETATQYACETGERGPPVGAC